VKIGQYLAYTGQYLAYTGQYLAYTGQYLANTWPILANTGLYWPIPGLYWPIPGLYWPILAYTGQYLAYTGQYWPILILIHRSVMYKKQSVSLMLFNEPVSYLQHTLYCLIAKLTMIAFNIVLHCYTYNNNCGTLIRRCSLVL